MKTRAIIILFVLFWVGSLSACSKVIPVKDLYTDPGHSFVVMLRWHDFNGVAGFMDPEPAKAFLSRYAGDNDFRIVDVSEETVSFSQEGRMAVTSYHLEYYILPSATVKSRRFELEWQYFSGDGMGPGVWRIISFFPELR